MTKFYFVRHGQMDFSMAGKKFYKGFAYNMMTLSEKGISQLYETAKNETLKDAQLIITSPFGRAMHSAAILSKELGLDMRVETDLHEWLSDYITYEYLPDEEASARYKALNDNGGRHPEGEVCAWESAVQMKERVMGVLEKYTDYEAVIVVCHGTLMQYVLEVEHPENGQVVEYIYP